jgi:outer membrane protein TolC
MVDLLDIQTQLDLARFERAQALYRCNKSYIEILLSAGILKEEVMR